MRRSILLPLLGLVGLVAASCTGGSTPAAGAAGGPPPPIAVTTAVVVEKPMAVNVRAVGAVEASSTVEVRAQVAGELLTVGFAEGQDVTAGQLLFTIDPRPFEMSLRQAEATLARDSAQLKNAEAQRTRAADLMKGGLLSKADFEASTTAAEALAATVAVDRAVVETATLQLQRTRVFAPVAGRTGALLVHPGAVIRANDTVPLVVINRIAPAYVSFAIPARFVSRLNTSPGARRAAVDAMLPNAGAVTGQVSFVDNAVDKASDTIRVKATFQNADRKLWPGAFVDVVLRLAVDEHAIVVPGAAVLPGQQGQYVYVVTATGTAEVRPVTVAWTEDRQTVIQSGLTAGETVVVDGQLRLTPGARVNAQPAESKLPRP